MAEVEIAFAARDLGWSSKRLDAARTALEQHKRGMPAGTEISGLESDGADRFFCGNTSGGTVRVIRQPR